MGIFQPIGLKVNPAWQAWQVSHMVRIRRFEKSQYCKSITLPDLWVRSKNYEHFSPKCTPVNCVNSLLWTFSVFYSIENLLKLHLIVSRWKHTPIVYQAVQTDYSTRYIQLAPKQFQNKKENVSKKIEVWDPQITEKSLWLFVIVWVSINAQIL